MIGGFGLLLTLSKTIGGLYISVGMLMGVLTSLDGLTTKAELGIAVGSAVLAGVMAGTAAPGAGEVGQAPGLKQPSL